MRPPIFEAVDVAGVKAVLKQPGKPLRFYSFGEAPQNPTYPYAVWQQVFGAPENYLGDSPDADAYTVQVDVYAKPQPDGAAQARQVALALRDALEPVCYITAWRGESVDPDTRNYRVGFTCEWIVNR